MTSNSLIKEFKQSLNYDYGVQIENANLKELYNSLGKVLMSYVNKDWQKSIHSTSKRVGYLSAEFLIGRLLYANMLNMGVIEDVKKTLESKGIDFNSFEDVEDAALGNGGLGRLAACFLESAASIGKKVDGYGLRYRFGLFKQSFVDGFQNEEADDWLKWGDPFSFRKEDESVIVNFADYSVRAVPYDTAVIGYNLKTINTLRLWQSEVINKFDFKAFDNMQGLKIAENDYKAEEITAVLYPNDNTYEGKKLRLRQQYFMVSATIQDVVNKYKKISNDFTKLNEYIIFQLNDTHPVLAIPELIRVLTTEGLSFEDALAIAKKTFNFTNHTIMGEALERWPLGMIYELIPAIGEILKMLENDIRHNLNDHRFFIVRDDVAYMANLAIYVAGKVNGVARIHTEILKNDTFKDWYEIYPEKFVNVTNGITPRRWLLLNNPKMAKEITKLIGDKWPTNLDSLVNLESYINNKEFVETFKNIKYENKLILADYIKKHEGIEIDADSIFDIQIKRLHEYKRQLLNALSILYIYFELKEGNLKDLPKVTFIFGAKSAPGYYMAKAIIKFINEIANLINNDQEISSRIKVVFVQNYNVSYAEKLVCACDFSEQISMAGMEASGTGNMKFMLNGTPTLGTLDGANVEICEEAGKENNYIFGATVEEVKEVKNNYNSGAIINGNLKLKRVVETLVDGTFNDNNTGVLKSIYDTLYHNDTYLVAYDFASYIETKLKAFKEYGSNEYFYKCLKNMANAGKFSSDRSIRDYVEEIWHI